MTNAKYLIPTVGSPNGDYDAVCCCCRTSGHVGPDGTVHLFRPHEGPHSWQVARDREKQ